MIDKFSLGSVVVPALDSVIVSLGHDVKKLQQRALGIVVESSKKKALISFPEIKLTMWLDHAEMKDVLAEAEAGVEAFKNILPADSHNLKTLKNVWLIHFLIRELRALFVLGLEKNELQELWVESEEDKLADYFGGDAETPIIKLGLGLESLKAEQWMELKNRLGERLLFEQILPSGMHKMELCLYLKDLLQD